jgi:hypothetical protein
MSTFTVHLLDLAGQIIVGIGFLSIVELIGMLLFFRLAFRLGPCILREERTIPNPASSGVPDLGIFKTETGKFKFVATDECLGRADPFVHHGVSSLLDCWMVCIRNCTG